jgi:hypothetical protein
MPYTKYIARCKIGIILLVLIVIGACRAPVIIYYNAPSLPPGTRPEMNTPGYWIGRHPDPDALIMAKEDIPWFNECIRFKTNAVQDILQYPAFRDGQALKNSFRKMLGYVSSQGYVTRDGKKASKDFLSGMEAEMGLEIIPSKIEVRWALTMANCDQRLLPTSQPLYKDTTDTSIDRLQNSALDFATPVVILHESIDGAWLYVVSAFSDGWVEAGSVASCTLDELACFEAEDAFIIITEAKADLFLDPVLRQHHTYLHMGVRLPVSEEWEPGPDINVIQILVPFRTKDGRCSFDAAYISESQVHRGYLPYTPRHAIQQAFKLLHAPYGWGGMYGEQDCSRFIQEVFATMGIILPRNSSQQAKVGMLVASFGKKDSVSERIGKLSILASGGITTLQFPGHIMLFLGMVDGIPYAIHDIFAYTEPATPTEKLVAINRVAVTSLNVGSGTKKGSLLQRIARVSVVVPGSIGQ